MIDRGLAHGFRQSSFHPSLDIPSKCLSYMLIKCSTCVSFAYSISSGVSSHTDSKSTITTLSPVPNKKKVVQTQVSVCESRLGQLSKSFLNPTLKLGGLKARELLVAGFDPIDFGKDQGTSAMDCCFAKTLGDQASL